MRALVFEGDPEEVARALKALGVAPDTSDSPSLNSEKAKPSAGNNEEDEDDEEDGYKPITSVNFARKVITRRALAPNQRKLLVEIYNAGEDGILGSELVSKMRLSQSQFRGVTGAWGRRVANTPGYDDESFFEWDWDYNEGSYRYRLPPAVREAIAREVIKD